MATIRIVLTHTHVLNRLLVTGVGESYCVLDVFGCALMPAHVVRHVLSAIRQVPVHRKNAPKASLRMERTTMTLELHRQFTPLCMCSLLISSV